MILTARELAGFLKPPTVHCVPRTSCAPGTLLPPPPALPTFEENQGGPDPARAGRHARRASSWSGSAPPTPSSATSPAARATARPSSAIAQFVHLVRSGHGGLFLDPHGDALERIEPYLAEAESPSGSSDRPRPGPPAAAAGLEPL